MNVRIKNRLDENLTNRIEACPDQNALGFIPEISTNDSIPHNMGQGLRPFN